jgi:hypothetical protein
MCALLYIMLLSTKYFLIAVCQVREVPLRPHSRSPESQGQREGIHPEQLERMSGGNQGFGYGSVMGWPQVELSLMDLIRPQGHCALETRLPRDVWS